MLQTRYELKQLQNHVDGTESVPNHTKSQYLHNVTLAVNTSSEWKHHHRNQHVKRSDKSEQKSKVSK